MTKLREEFFARGADEVAKDLLGRYLVCKLSNNQKVKLRLKEVAAYEGSTKTTSEGTKYALGLISISTKFGQRLLDIATGKPKQASCVTLRSAELELEDRIEQINGPGNLTKILGITEENKDFYDGDAIYGSRLWIEGNSVDESEIKELKGNSKNCVGIYKY